MSFLVYKKYIIEVLLLLFVLLRVVSLLGGTLTFLVLWEDIIITESLGEHCQLNSSLRSM
jgi:hypothetical protein